MCGRRGPGCVEDLLGGESPLSCRCCPVVENQGGQGLPRPDLLRPEDRGLRRRTENRTDVNWKQIEGLIKHPFVFVCVFIFSDFVCSHTQKPGKAQTRCEDLLTFNKHLEI